LVSGIVSQCVVDLFEAVEVEKRALYEASCQVTKQSRIVAAMDEVFEALVAG
jgi:hypothetical protein